MENTMAKIMPLVALMLLFSGCMGGTDNTTTTPQTDTTGATVAQETATTQPGTVRTTLSPPTTQKPAASLTDKITDLTAAMTAGMAMKCTYAYKNIQSEGWIKGQKYYFKTTMPQGVGYVISDGTWMYTWQEGQTQGVKFNIAQMKTLSEGKEQGYQDMKQVSADATNVQCTPDAAGDSKFTPPSNIQFQDMGELLKQMQNAGAGG